MTDILFNSYGAYKEYLGAQPLSTFQRTSAREDTSVRTDILSAIARQAPDFGNATVHDKNGGDYFPSGAGTDISTRLHGVDGGLCQSLTGVLHYEIKLTVTFDDDHSENMQA